MWVSHCLKLVTKHRLFVTRDMHAAVCGGRAGLCDAMRPASGADLLRYLRKVNFVGELKCGEGAFLTLSKMFQNVLLKAVGRYGKTGLYDT